MLSLVCVVVSSHATEQQLPRLKVTGEWQGDAIVAHRIQTRDAGQDPARVRVQGKVNRVAEDVRWLQIGSISVVLPPDVSRPTNLRAGDAIELDALRNSDGQLTATRVWIGDPLPDTHVELIGAVADAREQGATTRLRVGGLTVLAPTHLYRGGRTRLHRLDDRRPANQATFQLGQTHVTVGGEIEVASEVNLDRDLNRDASDDEAEGGLQAELESYFEFASGLSAFAEVKLEHSVEYAFNPTRSDDRFELQRGETWLYADRPLGLPLGLQIGRQNFADEREWWWDTDLDAVRLLFSGNHWSAEAALAHEIGRETLTDSHADPEEEAITRFIASGRFALAPSLALSGYAMHQRDTSARPQRGTVLAHHEEDEDDAKLTWLGVRVAADAALGSVAELDLWVDFATVWGKETHFRFRDLEDDGIVVDEVNREDRGGWAFDVGTSVTLPSRLEPTFTIGYAMGSGAEDADGTFRETGLNDNTNKFNGVSRFRYYGELARPELSNLSVTTLAMGIRFAGDNSLEVIHHGYRQFHARPDHSLRIDRDANGADKDLGDELNVVLSFERWEHWELELTANHFLPGNAFDQANGAWSFASKLNYNF